MVSVCGIDALRRLVGSDEVGQRRVLGPLDERAQDLLPGGTGGEAANRPAPQQPFHDRDGGRAAGDRRDGAAEPVLQHRVRAVTAGRPGDRPAGVDAGPAEVEPAQRGAVAAGPGHRAIGEQLPRLHPPR
jgi:hypothetical protein